MKKLLAALAVVAGLGFVVSCSDEVSEYTLINEEPTLGTSHERTGTLTGTYEHVYYDKTSFTTVKPDADELSEFETTTVEGVIVWYKKLTEKTDFSTSNAKVGWTVKDKTDEGDYLLNNKVDSTTYTISFTSENIDYSNFSYKVSGRSSADKWYDGVSTLMPGNVEVSKSSFKIKKVGKTYIYAVNDSDITTQVTGNIEGDTFTIANLVETKDAPRVPYYAPSKDGDIELVKYITLPNLVDTVTYSNLKFTKHK